MPDPHKSVARGHVARISTGRGIPKDAVKEALVSPMGVVGDEHTAPYIAVWGGHGGLDKAVMLWSSEVILDVNAKRGSKLFCGACGEQITLAGIDWRLMKTGVQVAVGFEVLLEVTYLKSPCKKQFRYFTDAQDASSISPKENPNSARVYCRVLRPGRIKKNDLVFVHEHPEGKQEVLVLN
eukprot:TRINITY_DN18664_c0_g1_i2.p1 TRINITY_DN18664_c0_g1~~TRINITY_DN18664_c0_g1_i2.p1  ORF type:complete len:181 (-),score=28.82 TRINITY_DN18664_c0_g1_i2:101-643(-)